MRGALLLLVAVGAVVCDDDISLEVAEVTRPVHDSHHDVGTWMATRHQYSMVQIAPLEVVCPDGCTDHGTCNATSGGCTCDVGYYGPACDTAFVCFADCSSRGVCVGHDECVCPNGFEGIGCEMDVRCPERCNGHGTCMNAGTECWCDKAWTGEFCGEPNFEVDKPPRQWQRLFPPESPRVLGIKPTGRHDHAAVLVGGDSSDQVLVWGGVTSSSPTNDMWLLDTLSSQWLKVDQPLVRPSPRYNFAAGANDVAMFVFGGYVACSATLSNDLWQWEFEEQEWMALPMVLADGVLAGPVPRVGHTLTVVDDNLIVVAGKGSEGMLSDAWIFDTVSARWSPLTQCPFGARIHHTAVRAGSSDKVYVFGGLASDATSTDGLYTYSVVDQEWDTVSEGAGPSPRFQHTSFWREDKLYVFGGQSSDSTVYLNDLWEFDGEGQAWTALNPANAPQGMVGVASLAVGNSAVLLGGLGTRDVIDVFQINFADMQYSHTITQGNLPVPRMLHSGDVLADRLWVMGGEATTGVKLGDVWSFHLYNHMWQQHLSLLGMSDDGSEQVCGDSGDGTSGLSGSTVPWPLSRGGHATTTTRAGEGESLERYCDGEHFVVMFGGEPDEPGVALNDIWVWCPKLEKFTEVIISNNNTNRTSSNASTPILTPLSRPTARSASSMLYHNDRVVIFGGMTAARQRLSDLWTCSLLHGGCSEVSVMGHKRPHTRRSMNLHLDLRADGGVPQYVVFGGYWKEAGNCSTCPGGMSVGHGETDKALDIWRFETQYSRWRKVHTNNSPTQRHVAGSFMYEEKMVMFGGYALDGSSEFGDMWLYNAEHMQWHLLGADGLSPTGRHEHSFDMYFQERKAGDKIHAVVFGGIGTNGLRNDVWMTEVTDVMLDREPWRPPPVLTSDHPTVASKRGVTVRVAAETTRNL